VDYLISAEDNMVFKGGTCLAKVYTNFNRLSEDLDLAIPTEISASRSERRARSAGVKSGDVRSNLYRHRPFFNLFHTSSSEKFLVIVNFKSIIGSNDDYIRDFFICGHLTRIYGR